VEAVKALMRFFSYLFHGLLALFLIAVSGLALGTGAAESLHLGMLPWSGATLTYVTFFGALAGLMTTILAMRGTLRILFLIWSLLVVILLIKGYVFSSYKFTGGNVSTAGYLMAASLVALIGAWFVFRNQPRRASRY
jgi:hypothetical protein